MFVCDDAEAFRKPCIYCQLESNSPPFAVLAEAPVEGEDVDDEPEQDPLASLTECRFVPADPGVLMTLYHALSDGAALNPDSEARRPFSLCVCVGGCECVHQSFGV
jgi:hypothetical protein